ncbi:MAG: NAD-dependent epimerase/dehydratase family protein [Planctomycetota bacterium]
MSYYADKKVMVTGGGGFLGSHVVEQLKELGAKEVFVPRSKDYNLVTEADTIRMFDEHPCDVVFHLAGLVGGIGANRDFPADYFYQNLMLGVHVLHYAWKSGAEKVVAASAGCGYPEEAPLPIKESDYWNGFPQTVSAPYSLAKRMLHVQSMAYWRQHKFPIVIAMPGNIYGPYDNFDLEAAHVVPALVRKFVEATDDGKPQVDVWGTGKASRDFCYAGDVAKGMIMMGEKFTEPTLLNMSMGKEATVKEVVDGLTEITGFPGEINWQTDKPEGQSRRLFDMSKTQSELGYVCDTSLKDGLKKTVDWYRANRSTARNEVAAPVS